MQEAESESVTSICASGASAVPLGLFHRSFSASGEPEAKKVRQSQSCISEIHCLRHASRSDDVSLNQRVDKVSLISYKYNSYNLSKCARNTTGRPDSTAAGPNRQLCSTTPAANSVIARPMVSSVDAVGPSSAGCISMASSGSVRSVPSEPSQPAAVATPFCFETLGFCSSPSTGSVWMVLLYE
ncbi:hypothetical protein SAMN05444271_15710 [Halohasta litchfieldiae]|uniref:Uncharacterized protein n=1 Tax=Halohasta litchfieldiae TaxID=1073996 RepID=A0A1H6Y536_9EURY|nr:hypothetical protein SAMN05444271_15710 [Halohasta litchfieldiae]